MPEATPPPEGVIVEFIPCGAYVRVCAVDAATGTEAVISGPANAPREHLTRTAMAKLAYILRRNSTPTEGGGGAR